MQEIYRVARFDVKSCICCLQESFILHEAFLTLSSKFPSWIIGSSWEESLDEIYALLLIIFAWRIPQNV